MSNRSSGNAFEQSFAEILAKNGFWVHRLTQNQTGQPADIVAVKNHKAWLIDCKVCAGNYFNLSRVEQNQHTAMTLWRECGNGEGWFAIQIKDEIYMIPYITMEALDCVSTRLTYDKIRLCGTELGKWVVKC